MRVPFEWRHHPEDWQVEASTAYEPMRRSTAWLRVVIVIAGAAMFVAWTVVRGREIEREVGRKLHLGAAPFVGEWSVRWTWGLLPAFVMVAAVVWFGPLVAANVRLRVLTPITMLAGVAVTLAAAASHGSAELFEPITDKSEYWAGLGEWRPLGAFIDTFLRDLNDYSVHVRGHPPGFPATLLVGRSVGIDDPWFPLLLSYIGVALTIGGVMWTVSIVAGHDVAHRLAPWLVVAPFAVWMGTSADAWFAGLGAVAIALCAIAMDRERRKRPLGALAAPAVVGGLVFGFNAFNTYAAVLLGAIPLFISIRWRVWRWIPWAVIGALIPVVVFRLAGFWWFAGVDATHDQYYYGTAQFRPYTYFVWANLAVLLIVAGPAALAGWALMRRKWHVVLPSAVVFAVLASDISGYTKAETERIWLMFTPWLLVGAAQAFRRRGAIRMGLAAQSTMLLGLQIVLMSKW